MTTPTPIRLLVHGASGRMGSALLRLAASDPRFAIAAAVSRSGGSIDGVQVLASGRIATAPEFDVMVDFSLPAAFDAALELCMERGCAFVSGTTGLSQAQRNALDAAAATVPCVWEANFSVGIAVLGDLVRRAAAALRVALRDGLAQDGFELRQIVSLGANAGEMNGGDLARFGARRGSLAGQVQQGANGANAETKLARAADEVQPLDVFRRVATVAAGRARWVVHERDALVVADGFDVHAGELRQRADG